MIVNNIKIKQLNPPIQQVHRLIHHQLNKINSSINKKYDYLNLEDHHQYHHQLIHPFLYPNHHHHHRMILLNILS